MGPHLTIGAPAYYDMPITRQRARELARGLREQIILEGNEDSTGEVEKEYMTLDACEEETNQPTNQTTNQPTNQRTNQPTIPNQTEPNQTKPRYMNVCVCVCVKLESWEASNEELY